MRVLLIEDNLADAVLVRENLADAGAGRFEVIHAQRLSEGIQRLRSETFDVVLLDLSLPDSHGIETFTEAHSQAHHVPIVVLTGLDDQTLALKAVSLGAQDYLVKGEAGPDRLSKAVLYAIQRHRRPPEGAIQEGISKVFRVLRQSGLRVSNERLDGLIEAVAARSEAVGHISVDRYLDRLKRSSISKREFRELVKVLTVGETYFFRNSNHMWAFRGEMLPAAAAIWEDKASPELSDRPITIWSAGCSTGEEPYSLAILVDEERQHYPHCRFEIIGSDINEDSLRAAQEGVYDERAVRELPSDYVQRHFGRSDGRYVISPEIKRMVNFAYHNLLEVAFPAPMGAPNSVYIIFCRNVFIYFSDEIVTEIARRFHQALIPGGFLVVGHSEMLDHSRLGFEMEFLSGAYVYRKPSVGASKRGPTARVKRAVPDKRARATDARRTVDSVKPRVELRPEEAASLVEEARLSADRGNYDDAVGKATQAIDLDPTNPCAY